ncbi:MAG: hypothetical protein LAO23_09970 [Acidobacteriia bacterium]|nr:hypothetical protein [Terriglobia bacterium]
MVSPTELAASQEPMSDEEVVARVLASETGMFEIVMHRHNQRLYRVARAILRNDGEAEDVMQDACVRAYEHLDQFAGVIATAPGMATSLRRMPQATARWTG